jgi:hypothetical protein
MSVFASLRIVFTLLILVQGPTRNQTDSVHAFQPGALPEIVS